MATPSTTGAALLEGLAASAAREGAAPLVMIAEGIASEGDKVGAFASLPKDKCVVVYARGSRGVGDLDLFGYADDGSPLATDESPSAEAGFLLCPPHPTRVYVAARVASGGGVVAIGAQEVGVDAAPKVAAAVGARGRGEDSGRLESWPGLDKRIVAHRRAIGSSWEDVRRFSAILDARAATRTSIAVEAGRCLDVLVVPNDEVSTLDVVAEAEDGRVMARAWADGKDRAMVLCSEHGDTVTIAARPRGGSGVAAFVLGRSPKGALSEINEPTRIERTSAAVGAEEARAAFDKIMEPGWGRSTKASTAEARVGSRTTVALKLAPGCSRIDVHAGKPLGPVAASLFSASGALLTEGEGSARATLYACGAGGELRVDVESRGRPGPFVIESRSWKDVPSELGKRPLAAARLLDRVIGMEPRSPAVVEDARAIELEPGKLVSSSFVVAQGTCTEAIVALEAGSGIDLRLVDDATGEDVLGRGRNVASQRLCAGKTSRKAKMEVRVDQGPAPALVLLRTEGN